MRSVIGIDQLLAHLDAVDPDPLFISGVTATDWDGLDPSRIPSGSIVLGNRLGERVSELIARAGSAVFSPPPVPYDAARAGLYTAGELFSGFDPTDPCTYCDTLDATIYQHYLGHGGSSPGPAEALLRRVHDHQIGVHLQAWLRDRKVVAIMGGHDMNRRSPEYAEVVELGRALARAGYTVATGGGPGAMEGAHLGAYLANAPEAEMAAAIRHLQTAPSYTDRTWLSTAFEVKAHLDTLGEPAQSIGIPTWAYGHEPPNAFATAYAKYFENSLREDGLVSIASHGIVFTRGNAGTVQEIFQDATQNHYGVVASRISPMVFLGSSYWEAERPVIPLLRSLSRGKAYDEMIGTSDSSEETLAFIEDHPPVRLDQTGWSFCGEFCR